MAVKRCYTRGHSKAAIICFVAVMDFDFKGLLGRGDVLGIGVLTVILRLAGAPLLLALAASVALGSTVRSRKSKGETCLCVRGIDYSGGQ